MPEYPECAHDLCAVDLRRTGTCVQLYIHRNCEMTSPVHQVVAAWVSAPRYSFQGPGRLQNTQIRVTEHKTDCLV